MAKAGRKRKTYAERYPSGAVLHHREDRMAAALPRTQEAVRNKLLNPWMASQLGQLWLAKKITVKQRDAGVHWAEAVEAYKRIVLGVPGSVRTMNLYNAGVSGGESDYPERMVKRAKRRYERMREAVLDRAGRLGLKRLNALCLDDEVLSYGERQDAVNALDAIAALISTGQGRRHRSAA